MKFKTLLLGLFFVGATQLYAQNEPALGTLSKDKVNIGINQDFIVLNGIDDRDVQQQNISLEVTSNNQDVLQVLSVNYTQGSKYAIINVKENGREGQAVLTVRATDPNGTTSKNFNVSVGQFLKRGINWGVYDIVFWQQVVPLNEKALLDSVITRIEIPKDEEIYNRLPLTVGPEGNLPKHDFFTTLYRGFLQAPATGEYTFTITSQDQSALFLSTDERYSNAKQLIRGSTSTAVPAKVNLEANKIYAIYAVNWAVHDLNFQVSWSGPQVSNQIVSSDHLFPFYDLVKPTSPTNNRVILKGIDIAKVAWKKGNDEVGVKNYNLYLNGEKFTSTEDTLFILKNLNPNTDYEFFVTTTDLSGNESLISNAVTFKTYGSDNGMPEAPKNLKSLEVSDLSVRIAWDKAKDNETEIYGYNVFLDGRLVNTAGIIIDTNFTSPALAPLTTYNFTVEAVDIANNKSNKSTPLVVKTLKFDPQTNAPGIKKGRLTVNNKPIARNAGFGITGAYEDDSYYNGFQNDLLKDLKPGVARWGTLGANGMSYSAHSGAGKRSTYAKFMDHCNRINTMTAIVIGVQNDTDWMKDSTTFTKFMEYLNGPANSPEGAKRAAEGFTEPLLKNSKGLIIDLGTEVWGGAGLHQAEIGADYPTYAKWCRRMAKIIRKSPYYDSTKVFITYSGRNPSPLDSYGLNQALVNGDMGEVDWLSVSGYLGGNMNYDPAIPAGKSELDYYKNGISRMSSNILGTQLQLRESFRFAKRFLPTNFYESNMTTPNYNGRLGQAIIMTDYLASVMEFGSTLPSIFHLFGGEWRIVETFSNNKLLPFYHTARLFNRYTLGNMLEANLTSSARITDAAGRNINFDPVGCHVYSNQGKYAILLTSRDFENDFQLQLNLPDGATVSNGKRYVISGENFNTRDALVDSAFFNLTDSMIVTVPKHGMVLITYSSTDLKQNLLPLGYTRFGIPSKINIIADNGTSGSTNGQTLNFRTTFEPSNALFKDVAWEIVKPNELKVTSTPNKDRIALKGSGDCEGNGGLTLKVYSSSDKDIFTTVAVSFSNQGTDCPNSTEDALFAKGITVYPNPAQQYIQITSQIDKIEGVVIKNVLGEELIKKNNIGQYAQEIDLSLIPQGVYFIQIQSRSNKAIFKIVKE